MKSLAAGGLVTGFDFGRTEGSGEFCK